METLIWAKITKIGDILRYIPTIVETPIWVPLNLTFFNAPTSQGCPQSCALPPTGSWFNELAWTWAGPTRRSKDIQKSTVFSWPRYQRTHLYTSIYIYQTISIDDRWIDVKWREREREREGMVRLYTTNNRNRHANDSRLSHRDNITVAELHDSGHKSLASSGSWYVLWSKHGM